MALGEAVVRRRPEITPAPEREAEVAAAKEAKRAAFLALARSDETPIRPERIVAALQETLPDDAVLALDAGTPCPYFSAHYEIMHTGRHVFSNRAHGALGYALPAAMGAALGRPGSKVVGVMGDGSFGFNAGELETAARLDLPVTFVVISNASFGWIKAGQKSGFGARYFSVDFCRTDHARVAEAFGVKAWRVTDPGDLGPALAAAIEHGGPSLVDVVTQPSRSRRPARRSANGWHERNRRGARSMSDEKAVPTVQVDNDLTRVTRWDFTPGAATGWHRHEHDYVIVPVTTGSLRLTGPDGVHEAALTAGVSYYRKAGIEHDVVNANDHDFAFVEVEFKSTGPA